MAETVAAMSRSATVATKAAVNRLCEMTFTEGVRYERRAAFLEKRIPRYADALYER